MKVSETSSFVSEQLQGPALSWLESKIVTRLNTLLLESQGCLQLTFPGGYRCRFGHGQPQADVQLQSLKPLWRLWLGGDMGWAEGYMAGEWQSADLTGLIRWAMANEPLLKGLVKAGFIQQGLSNLYHRRRDNSRRGSRRNIAAHYDLGNDFYRHWLDGSMTYSSALYQESGESLADAQTNKFQRIVQMLDAKPGQRLLEIGCGWGSFAEHAARVHDLHVDGITLSQQQLAWARQTIENQGLEDKVNLSLTDYRDVQGQYDHLVSIEMFEAVGEAHWDAYFQTLRKVLKPEGAAVLQIISIDNERFHHYRKQADFIQRYVFPGGMLPSVAVLKEKFDQHGFELAEMQLFGKDYARTLREWHSAFIEQWPAIKQLGFDDKFYRLWRYYLSYCEGGFETDCIDVGLYKLKPR